MTEPAAAPAATPKPAFLPYARQTVDPSDIDAVVAVLRGDFLTTGPAVDAFEAGLAQQSGAGHAVAVNSGTAALHAAYAALGLGPGDEVITSSLTFASTANAAHHLGARVRFADIDPRTGTLDPAAVAPLINERTRLIVPVDYAGHPADYRGLRALADAHQLKLVADAAHSLGATYHGAAVGTLAHATATSFHPVKPITTAEGGALLTDDPAVAQHARAFRTHGVTRDRAAMTRDDGPWYYQMHDLGLNYRLSDLHAALGLSQLQKLDAFIARRRALAARYRAALADETRLTLPHVEPGVEPGWHLFVVRVRGDAARRRPFFEALRAAGLGVQVHYIPVHHHPWHASRHGDHPPLPHTEDFYARCVSLPLFPAMTDDDADRVIDTVRAVAAQTLD